MHDKISRYRLKKVIYILRSEFLVVRDPAAAAVVAVVRGFAIVFVALLGTVAAVFFFTATAPPPPLLPPTNFCSAGTYADVLPPTVI